MARDPKHLRPVADGPSPAALEDLDDDALALLMQEGEQPAFAELVRRHQELVRGYASRFLGERDLADDVAQDVFVTVWSNRDEYKAQSKFKSYVLTITFYRAQQAARKHRRFLQKVRRERRKQVRRDTLDSPLGTAIRNAQHRRVLDALQDLPERQRQVLILRYFEDLSVAEIAETLGRPTGTIKSDTSRAIARLQKVLGGRL